jgi:hypothetical protein
MLISDEGCYRLALDTSSSPGWVSSNIIVASQRVSKAAMAARHTSFGASEHEMPPRPLVRLHEWPARMRICGVR